MLANPPPFTNAVRQRLAQNWQTVRQQVAQACAQAGRQPEEITIVAVTKYVPADYIQALYELGLRDVGESRPQALWQKSANLPADLRWHLIGPLQTNKVARTIPCLTLLHSLDRLKLATALADETQRQGRVLDVLLEVNGTGELAKHGFTPTEIGAYWEQIRELPGLRVQGLMCMARDADSPTGWRQTFDELRQLRDQLQTPTWPMPILSMGMSQDFAEAIAAGATHLRIGSAFFTGLFD